MSAENHEIGSDDGKAWTTVPKSGKVTLTPSSWADMVESDKPIMILSPTSDPGRTIGQGSHESIGKALNKLLNFNFGQINIMWEIHEVNYVPMNVAGIKYKFHARMMGSKLQIGVPQHEYIEWYEISKNSIIIKFKDFLNKIRYLEIKEVEVSKPSTITKVDK
jgi:hypothetical protein